jgi:hypothetical protein
VDPRAGLDDMEEWKFLTLPGFEVRTLGLPARSQPMCRLRYPRLSNYGRVVINITLMSDAIVMKVGMYGTLSEPTSAAHLIKPSDQ